MFASEVGECGVVDGWVVGRLVDGDGVLASAPSAVASYQVDTAAVGLHQEERAEWSFGWVERVRSVPQSDNTTWTMSSAPSKPLRHPIDVRAVSFVDLGQGSVGTLCETRDQLRICRLRSIGARCRDRRRPSIRVCDGDQLAGSRCSSSSEYGIG